MTHTFISELHRNITVETQKHGMLYGSIYAVFAILTLLLGGLFFYAPIIAGILLGMGIID